MSSKNLILNPLLIFMTMMVATFSKILWTLPVQFMFYEDYVTYLTYSGGEFSFWLILCWFHWGAFKVVLIDLNDHMRGTNTYGLTRKLKLCALVPIAPLLNLKTRIAYESLKK